LRISRLDLDGLGSPTALAAKIHELEPQLPTRVPVEDLCRHLGIESIGELETDGFEAAIIMDDLKAGGVILVATGRSDQRRRYSIAHELGHFLIPAHRPSGRSSFECSLADLHLLAPKDRDRRRRIEAEANRFAAHLLMPPGVIRTRIRQTDSSLERVVALAREFGVSKEAIARAWVDAHREPVAVVLAHRGRIVRRYRNEDFPWLPDWNGQLPRDCLAVAMKPQPGAYSPIEEIEPTVWLSERDAGRVLSLTEQVLGQRDDYALILLQAELDENSDI
jgi:Zn-dependent peptidase ImmA (M78 family)